MRDRKLSSVNILKRKTISSEGKSKVIRKIFAKEGDIWDRPPKMSEVSTHSISWKREQHEQRIKKRSQMKEIVPFRIGKMITLNVKGNLVPLGAAPPVRDRHTWSLFNKHGVNMKEFGAGKINPGAGQRRWDSGAQRRLETALMAQERTSLTLEQRRWERRK